MAFPSKTLIFGACGFLGSALFRFYRSFYPDLIGTHYEKIGEYKKFDLSDPHLESLALNGYSHAIIAAGVPNLRACELEPKRTRQINVQGTLKLIEELIAKKITPVVLSSDYVFDGKVGSYDERSKTNPLNEYGRQKAELERLMECNHKNETLVIRLSKVYGLQKGDGTLLDEMILLMTEEKQVRAAFDQTFSPIEIDDVVTAIAHLQNRNMTGLFHVCGNEALSRLVLARRIRDALQTREGLVESISLDDLKDPFLRPKRTDMINHKLCKTIGFQMKSISSSIEFLISQYKNKG